MKRAKNWRWGVLLLVAAMLFSSACSGETAGPIPTEAPSEQKTTDAVTESASEAAVEPSAPEEIDIFAVGSPIGAYPEYVFDHEPTIDEMRATAVDLMRKALTVEWYTPEEFEVSTSISTTKFTRYERYAGIPYTGPNTSIYAFLDYLNLKTGRLLSDKLAADQNAELGSAFTRTIGSSCSGTAGWALLSVANSIHGVFQCYYMVYKNGWIPLGDYTYDLETPSFGKPDSKAFTDDIVKQYGDQKMYECYALLKPADVVVWQDHVKMGHTMMATEDAVVVRNADGSVNGEESYVIIQDQRPGGFEQIDEETGDKYHAQGRIDYKYTFKRLFEEAYIPMTIAEFQGTKAYEFPEVKLNTDKEIKSPDDLNGTAIVRVESNYPLATIALFARNKATGEKIRLSVREFSRAEVADGTASHFSLKGFAAPVKRTGVLESGDYEVTIEARTPNGQIFTPVKFDYTAN